MPTITVTLNLIHDDATQSMDYASRSFPSGEHGQIGEFITSTFEKASAEFPNETVPLALDATITLA